MTLTVVLALVFVAGVFLGIGNYAFAALYTLLSVVSVFGYVNKI